LQACERMGLPERNGALWPVFVAAIERDPIPAMKALGIGLDSVRPNGTENPLGIEASPIGIEVQAPKGQSLSCVGFARLSITKEREDDRLQRAREAQQHAIERHQRKAAPVPAAQADGGEWTRERDEHAHDLSAWH